VCSLRDAAEVFDELGVEVYGVSLDDVTDMAKFAEAQELNFQLLSDPDGSAAAKYGVLPDGTRFARRVTFIIDDKGVLRQVDEKVNVQAHGTDLLDMVVDLQG
jgi:peroxiredoxin Q/BCP